MREITLRAKAVINGESQWVYGHYISHFEFYGSMDIDDNQKRIWKICTETLGQYTGIKDKNNIKIHEGDIVKIQYNDLFLRKEVKWDAEECGFICVSPKYEIIGNIHDNPEILGNGDTGLNRIRELSGGLNSIRNLIYDKGVGREVISITMIRGYENFGWSVHLFDGVENLAMELEVSPLTVEYQDGEEYDYKEIYFIYNRVKYFEVVD